MVNLHSHDCVASVLSFIDLFFGRCKIVTITSYILWECSLYLNKGFILKQMVSADVLDLLHIVKCFNRHWKRQLYLLLLVSRINSPRRMIDLTQLLCLYLLRKSKLLRDWLNQINRLELTLWVICSFLFVWSLF